MNSFSCSCYAGVQVVKLVPESFSGILSPLLSLATRARPDVMTKTARDFAVSFALHSTK